MTSFLLIGGLTASLFALDTSEKKTDPDMAGLKKKGIELIAAGDYAKAIPLLEEINRVSASDDTLKLELVKAYEKRADQISKNGLSNEALALLQKAKKLSESISESKSLDSEEKSNPKFDRSVIQAKQFVASDRGDGAKEVLAQARARELFDQALDSFKQKQYGLARALLKDGIKFDDKNFLIYELLGDIEYYSQNLSVAKDAYQKSYLLQKNERVEKKLNRLIAEEKLNQHLSEYLDEHFIIRYNRKQDVEGSEIRQYLRDSYRTISTDFGHYLNYKTVVILYDKEGYHAIKQIPHWSGALFDGKIRIPTYEAQVNRKKLRKLIQHELTHVFIIDISKDRCPVWLHEGLAQYEENKIIPVDLRLLSVALKKNSLLSVEELEKGITQEISDIQALFFYHQSFSIASKLITDYRFVKMKQLLKALGDGEIFDSAFEKIYRVPFAEFFKAWKREVLANVK